MDVRDSVNEKRRIPMGEGVDHYKAGRGVILSHKNSTESFSDYDEIVWHYWVATIDTPVSVKMEDRILCSKGNKTALPDGWSRAVTTDKSQVTCIQCKEWLYS